MTWAELHAESERLAIEAHLASKSRDTKHAQGLYKKAAQVEQQALNLLDASNVRTRGITAVSAVALWFKAVEYVRAEFLCGVL